MTTEKRQSGATASVPAKVPAVSPAFASAPNVQMPTQTERPVRQFPNSPSLFCTLLSSGNISNSRKFCCAYLNSDSPHPNLFLTAWMLSPLESPLQAPETGLGFPARHFRTQGAPENPFPTGVCPPCRQALKNDSFLSQQIDSYTTVEAVFIKLADATWQHSALSVSTKAMPDMQEVSSFYCLYVWKRWECHLCLVRPSPEFPAVPNVPGILIRVQAPSREKAVWWPSPRGQPKATLIGTSGCWLCASGHCRRRHPLSCGQTRKGSAVLTGAPLSAVGWKPPGVPSRVTAPRLRQPSTAGSHPALLPSGSRWH